MSPVGTVRFAGANDSATKRTESTETYAALQNYSMRESR
jgi:hypothetical protein